MRINLLINKLTQTKCVAVILYFIVNSFFSIAYASDNVPISFAHLPNRITIYDGNSTSSTSQTFKVSPDEQYAVFSNNSSIYSVPILEGNPKKIFQSNNIESPLVFLITPDSSKVITYPQAYNLEVGKIHSTTINSGHTTELASFTSQDSSVFYAPEPVISPDGNYIVYVDTNINNSFTNLYSVSIATGQKTLLSTSFGRINGKILISPNNQYVVFRSDINVFDQFELYSVPISGGNLVKLNSNLPTGGDISPGLRNGYGGYAITPDSNSVVYVADQIEDNLREMFITPINQGTPRKVISPLLTANPEADISQLFQISPNGQFIVYRADIELDNIFEIYSIPLNGGRSVKISSSTINVGSYVDWAFTITSDSQRVIFRQSDTRDRDGESQSYNLFSTPINSSSTVKLNNSILGGNVSRFLVTPNGQNVVYSGNQTTLGTEELYSTPSSRRAITKLNQPLGASNDVSDHSFKITPDGLSVLYRADAVIDTRYELYKNSLDGRNLIKVSHDLPKNDQDAWQFYVSQNNEFTLYSAFESRVAGVSRKEKLYFQSDSITREAYQSNNSKFIPSILLLLLDE